MQSIALGAPAMRRLLYVAPDFFPSRSGYGNACTAFVEALSKHTSVEVDVVTLVPLGNHAELALPRVSVHRVSPATRAGRALAFADASRALWRRLAWLRNERAHDFTLFETAEFPRTALRCARRWPGQVAIRVHAAAETEWALYRDDWTYRFKRSPTRALFRVVPAILSTTPYYLSFVRERFLDRNELLVASKWFGVVPNVVREHASPAQEPTSAIRELLAQGPVLLALGRMDRHGDLQKNFRRTLLAFARVRRHPSFEGLRIVLVGRGDARPALERLARNLGLQDRALFVDHLSDADLSLLQREGHGVILASTFEGMSMFALESLAAGSPMLLSKAGGLADLVEDGANGETFDALDVEDMARALERYATRLLPDIEKAREASRRRYAARFLPEVTVRHFIEGADEALAYGKTFI